MKPDLACLILILIACVNLCAEPYSLDAYLFSDPRVIEEGDIVLFKVSDPHSGQELMPEQKIQVSPEGNMKFPGFESIQLRGKTIGQVREELTSRYRQTGALVSLALARDVSDGEQYIVVEGFVSFPMRQPWTKGVRIIEAICFAGGVDPRGDHRRVRLLRSGKATLIDLRIGSARDEILEPGDIIIVP